MKHKTLITTSVLSVFLLLGASSASATSLSYTDLSAWQAAVGTATAVEDFNSYTTDTWAPVDVGYFTITAVGSYAGDNGIEAYDPNPDDIQVIGGSWDRNIDGSSYYSGDVDNTIVTISFHNPIFAFGWDYTSLGSNDYLTVLGETFAFPFVGNPPANDFFGIVSDTLFTDITIGGSDGAFGADNFRFDTAPDSAPVPEPATMFLFGTGLVGFASTRIKRKKKA